MSIAGIDLGTHTILVSVPDPQGNPVILTNEVGEPSIRSVVFVDGANTLVGTEAVNAGIVEPTKCVQNAKRFLGTDKVLVTDDGKEYLAKDIAAIQLAEIRRVIESRTGELISQVAISVPANFNQRQRQEVIEAAQSVGFEVILTPNEPTAAAFGTKVYQRGDGCYLVVDVGGGTTDITALRISGNDSVVLASNGVAKLGGVDWNSRLFERVLEQCTDEFGFTPNEKEQPVLLQDLMVRIEQAKLTLTAREDASVIVHHEGKVVNCKITRHEFEEATADLVAQVTEAVQETVRETGAAYGDFKEIIPVGGPSQMPMIRKALENLCGKPPTSHTEPITAVALGTMSIGRMEIEKSTVFSVGGKKLPALDPRLREVTSHAIGVDALGDDGQFANAAILGKGKSIPASYTRAFQLAEPGQTAAFIRILQGDHGAPTDDCYEIGQFRLEGLKPVYDRPHRIDIQLHLDKNGILRAEAVDENSGKSADLEMSYKGVKASSAEN